MRYVDAVDAYRRALIRAALLRADGNRTHAAKALGMTRTYLQRVMANLGVESPGRRGRPRLPHEMA